MIDELISKYCIQQVGIQYSDIIISNSNFIQAVTELNKLGYYVLEVCWWEHNKISNARESLSMGGPIDYKDSDYYYGETNICKSFDKGDLAENLRQVLDYYENTSGSYNVDLFPSITLDIAYKD